MYNSRGHNHTPTFSVPRSARLRERYQYTTSEIGNKGKLGTNGGKWDFFWFLMEKSAKKPKMHFLLGDVVGGVGNSHFPPLGHKEKWGGNGGKYGKMGGLGGKWGKWQHLLIVAPHFPNKNLSNQKPFPTKNFPPLCPHAAPRDGKAGVAISDFRPRAKRLGASETQSVVIWLVKVRVCRITRSQDNAFGGKEATSIAIHGN